MIEKMLRAVVFFALFPGTLAYRCLGYRDEYIYCEDGCCGTVLYRYCCRYPVYIRNTPSNDQKVHFDSQWKGVGEYGSETHSSSNDDNAGTVAAIAGTVIGCIVGLCIIVGIIIATIKACNSPGTRGRIVHPVQYPKPKTGLFLVNSSAQPYPSTTQHGMAPSNYITRVGSYQNQSGPVKVG